MTLTEAARLVLRLLRHFLASVPFALFGAFVLTHGLARTGVRIARGARALAPELRCAQGHKVPVVGRWKCSACHCEYMGWIGRCEVCGEGADITTCPSCGVGVRLPWESR